MVLDILGRRDEARECLDRALARNDCLIAGLFSGRAGIALNLSALRARTGEEKLREAAIQIGDGLAALLHVDRRPGSGHPPGRSAARDDRVRPAVRPNVRGHRFGGISGSRRAALRQNWPTAFSSRTAASTLARIRRIPPTSRTGPAASRWCSANTFATGKTPSSRLPRIGVAACRAVFVLQPGLHQGRAGD